MLRIAVIATQLVKNGCPEPRPSYTHALANPELCPEEVTEWRTVLLSNPLAPATERAAKVTRPRRLEAARPAPDRGHEMPL